MHSFTLWNGTVLEFSCHSNETEEIHQVLLDNGEQDFIPNVLIDQFGLNVSTGAVRTSC
ncbi:hypothetical protein ACPCXF_04505 [Lysinibacillus agricola]